jgi:hypothetical protein
VVHDDETNLDRGGGLLTTSTDRALFVAKYDETGTHLWSDTFAIDYFSYWALDDAGAAFGLLTDFAILDGATGLIRPSGP